MSVPLTAFVSSSVDFDPSLLESSDIPLAVRLYAVFKLILFFALLGSLILHIVAGPRLLPSLLLAFSAAIFATVTAMEYGAQVYMRGDSGLWFVIWTFLSWRLWYFLFRKLKQLQKG